MNFAHYTDEPIRLAVALVNTFGWVSRTEYLHSPDDLIRLLAQNAPTWSDDVPAPRFDDLTGVRQVRARLRGVFDAPHAEAAVAQVNGLLAEHRARPSLSLHGSSPHLHFASDDGTLVDWLGVVTAMGLATVIADDGLERMGVCRAGECRDVYVDTSRNASRRHCSDTCRNRENVAAHRRRKAGA